MNITGKILRNINTPNIGIFVHRIREEYNLYKGKVSYFPLKGQDMDINLDNFIKDYHFFYQIDRFYKDFEILYNVETIKSFEEAKWKKMGPA